MKVKRKGLGQPSPAEEPAGPGAVGDSHAGAAGGLLLPNRVGQEEPTPIGVATPHPGERGQWGAAGSAGTSSQHTQSHPAGRLPGLAKQQNAGARQLHQLCLQIS